MKVKFEKTGPTYINQNIFGGIQDAKINKNNFF